MWPVPNRSEGRREPTWSSNGGASADGRVARKLVDADLLEAIVVVGHAQGASVGGEAIAVADEGLRREGAGSGFGSSVQAGTLRGEDAQS